MVEQKSPLMVLEIIGVIVILSFVIAFTGTSNTGGFYFEAKSYGGTIKGVGDVGARAFAGKAVQYEFGYTCADLTDVLTKKRIALEKQVELYPYNEDLKEEYETVLAIENTYKGYTQGLRGYEQRWKRQCLPFQNLALIVGIDDALAKDNVAFCCVS